jgi:hypothetical protein
MTCVVCGVVWWCGLSSASAEFMLKNPASASQVEGLLGKAHVPTLASGQVQGFMKFYFFARQVMCSPPSFCACFGGLPHAL